MLFEFQRSRPNLQSTLKDEFNIDRDTNGEIFNDLKQKYDFNIDHNLKTRFAEILHSFDRNRRLNELFGENGTYYDKWLLNLGIVNLIQNLQSARIMNLSQEIKEN